MCPALHTSLLHLMIPRGINLLNYSNLSPLATKREFSRIMNHWLTLLLPLYPIARQLSSPLENTLIWYLEEISV